MLYPFYLIYVVVGLALKLFNGKRIKFIGHLFEFILAYLHAVMILLGVAGIELGLTFRILPFDEGVF